MTYDPHALVIHIDGSAYDNPGGSGGIAAIVEYPDGSGKEPETIFEHGFHESTNNRMELRACIEALKWARDYTASNRPARVLILTDSMYVVQHHKSAPSWKKSKWRTREGRPVENSDLWDELLRIRSKITVRVDIEWEKGKSTAITKEIDKSAKKSAQGFSKRKDRGYVIGDVSRTKLPGIAPTMFPANGQEATIRIYRKGFISRKFNNECKIYFEVYSSEQQAYIAKHFAYSTPEMELVLHRHHHYLVRFNENPHYPMILEVVREVDIDENTRKRG